MYGNQHHAHILHEKCGIQIMPVNCQLLHGCTQLVPLVVNVILGI